MSVPSKTNLKNAMNRCTKEHHRLALKRDRLKKCMSDTLSNIDHYILHISKLDNTVTPYFMTFLNFCKLSKTVPLVL